MAPLNPIAQLDLENLLRHPQDLVRKLVASLVFAPPLSLGGGGGALARPSRPVRPMPPQRPRTER
ncbi:MAG: hypothetical protein V3T05_14215 [Myxococcota bacterium]